MVLAKQKIFCYQKMYWPIKAVKDLGIKVKFKKDFCEIKEMELMDINIKKSYN